MATNCSFKNIQISAKISFDSQFDNNINFGGIVGMAQTSEISYAICRVSEFGIGELSRNDNKIYVFGGLVGRLYNSSVLFSVIEAKFVANLTETFKGEVDIGGVAGVVSDGGSQIINVAIENLYDVTRNVLVNCGEVAGLVSNPTPDFDEDLKIYNISFIHFKRNVGINEFGNAGDYVYSQANISESGNLVLSNLRMVDGKYRYFSLQRWHPLLGDWDFRTIWHVPATQICLQSFISNFLIGVANSNSAILTGKMVTTDFKYGETAKMQFVFTENMDKFYSATALNLSGVEVAKIFKNVENGKTTYSLSGSDFYAISPIDNGFEIVIKNISMAMEGTYSVTTTANTYTAKISSKLFGEDGQVDETVVPGLVYYISDNNIEINPSTRPLSINKLTYSQHYRIGTKAVSGKPYAFEQWYMILEDGTTVALGKNLDFTFGVTEHFDGNFEIYAKYSVNACNITCKMDGGVVKIVVSDNPAVETSDQFVPVSKTEQSLRVEIYVDDNYDFDVEQFITELDVYKSQDPNVTFCTLRETKTEAGCVMYHFVLNLTTLTGDYSNAFTLNAKTTKKSADTTSWLWWVIGGVVGATVLIGIIVLIIVLVKRRGGGFGKMGGAGKISKKSYKNMYY